MKNKSDKSIDSLMSDIEDAEQRDNPDAEQATGPTYSSNEEKGEGERNEGITQISDYQRIGFDKFKSVDLRVAKIIDVEQHPTTRKPMYKLTLDVGELGTRVIVAGIAGYYSKDSLLGKKIVIVANLSPRNIAGVVSDGMLLAAEDEVTVSLIVPDKDASPGSRIH